jgi:aspartate kinase
MQKERPLIMKFGGAAVASPERFDQIAEIILRRRQDYPRIVIVVSAMGDMTDQLLQLAHRVNPTPPRREVDMLVSVGERISISLLAMALAGKGRSAVSFTGSQSGIITTAEHNEAQIIEVRPDRLLPHLNEGQIVIVAGFQGVSQAREITTLGRGGSDTTAVALGVALDADRIEFYKDVDGIYTADPKVDREARRCPYLSYTDALALATQGSHPVLHPRSLKLAARNEVPLHVLSFDRFIEGNEEGSWVGPRQRPQELSRPIFECES